MSFTPRKNHWSRAGYGQGVGARAECVCVGWAGAFLSSAVEPSAGAESLSQM